MSDCRILSTPPSRRSRKRAATRQAISEAATRLFFERGFDHVTVDEIAQAADVGRMTVFNHFRRKEDMFFDLDQVWRDDLKNALEMREGGRGPIEAFRLFAHQAIDQQRPYAVFSPSSQRFHDAMAASEALKARWRAIRDEAAVMMADVLTGVADDLFPSAEARLAANLMAAAWSTAVTQGQAAFSETQDTPAAEAVFTRLIDRATAGIELVLAGTPYL